MTAMPLKWHEENLVNFKANAERERTALAERQRNLERWDADILFRERQIAEAKRKGKPSYDGERFLGGFQWPPKTI